MLCYPVMVRTADRVPAHINPFCKSDSASEVVANQMAKKSIDSVE